METTETKHHVFSPSTLERREACPASYKLEEGLPSFDTENSKEGTLKHAAIAELITAYVDGKPLPDIDDVDVKSAFDKFLEILREIPYNDLQIFTERKLSYKFCGLEVYNGTADVVIVTPEKVVVIDWKFGHKEVTEAANNPQGAAYALAAMQEFDRNVADVHFYNPVIRQHSNYTFEGMEGIRDYVMGVIAECKRDSAPAVAGEKQCRYCKAAYYGTCPAYAEFTAKVMVISQKLDALPTLAEVPDAFLCELAGKFKVVAKFADRVTEEIKARCAEKGACGSYVLKTTSGGKEIPDINAAFNALSKVFKAEEFLTYCKVAEPALRKAYVAKMKERCKCKSLKEGEKMFAETMGDLIQQKAPRQVLAEA